MTPRERANEVLITPRRRKLIAYGSGTSLDEVNRLLKQFNQMREMMKKFTSKNPMKMMAEMNRMRQMMGGKR